MEYSSDFENIYKVFLTLPDKEKLYICSGEFKDSPYVKYRNCIIDKNDAVGFIEVYNLPGEKYDYMWRCDKKNSISNIIAKKYNFELLNYTCSKNEYVLHK